MRDAGAVLACTLRDRLRGLLRGEPRGGVLVLAPCSDIHTFGMLRDIDVAFVGGDGTVVASERAVSARRRVKCRGALMTLERFASDDEWPQPGDTVRLAIEVLRGSAGDEGGSL